MTVQPQPMPTVPPVPPPGAKVELLRETVEVQARTIRYLLANYDALLRKVERHKDKDGEEQWELTVGTAVTVADTAVIAKGFWNWPSSTPPGMVLYSDGTMTNNTGSNMVIYPVTVTEVEPTPAP